jgi:hypothetical protein
MFEREIAVVDRRSFLNYAVGADELSTLSVDKPGVMQHPPSPSALVLVESRHHRLERRNASGKTGLS